VHVWDIVLVEEVHDWYIALDTATAARVEAAIDALERSGPGLGRPMVDQIKSSRHPNMKELRPGAVRILFAFDPARRAILLVAGDKSGAWNQWYARAVPLADDRFDEWLKEQR
jgi:hypothetical protein